MGDVTDISSISEWFLQTYVYQNGWMLPAVLAIMDVMLLLFTYAGIPSQYYSYYAYEKFKREKAENILAALLPHFIVYGFMVLMALPALLSTENTEAKESAIAFLFAGLVISLVYSILVCFILRVDASFAYPVNEGQYEGDNGEGQT